MRDLSQAETNPLVVSRSKEIAECRRNPLVRGLKSVLHSAQSVLPNSIYKTLYDNSFSFYKGLLRLLYFRHVVYLWLAGNHSAFRKANAVYRVMPYSLVGSSGLEATFDAALELIEKGIPGAFVECGVAQGGCSALMAMVGTLDQVPRKIWLIDSFQGLPSPTGEDFDEQGKRTGKHICPLDRGSCLGTKSHVEWLLFSKFGLDRNSILLIEGWFQDTLPAYRDRIGDISLLRIDGDWYESTKCCLQHFYDNVVRGGYIIVDDYGVCFGCKRAVHEFFDERGLNPRLFPDGRGGILFSKSS